MNTLFLEDKSFVFGDGETPGLVGLGRYVFKSREIVFSGVSNVVSYSASVKSYSGNISGGVGSADVVAQGYGVNVIGVEYSGSDVHLYVQPWYLLAAGQDTSPEYLDILDKNWVSAALNVTGIIYGS